MIKRGVGQSELYKWEFRVVLYLIDSKRLGVSVTLPEFYAYAAPVGKTLRCPEAKLPRSRCKGVLTSMVLESGTRMAVMPGCFAIRRDQNHLSLVQISNFLWYSGYSKTSC